MCLGLSLDPACSDHPLDTGQKPCSLLDSQPSLWEWNCASLSPALRASAGSDLRCCGGFLPRSLGFFLWSRAQHSWPTHHLVLLMVSCEHSRPHSLAHCCGSSRAAKTGLSICDRAPVAQQPRTCAVAPLTDPVSPAKTSGHVIPGLKLGLPLPWSQCWDLVPSLLLSVHVGHVHGSGHTASGTSDSVLVTLLCVHCLLGKQGV